MIAAADFPWYLPHWQFFQKMLHADIFLIADDFPFRPKLRINRTGIRTAGGRQWLTVPVLKKNRGEQSIREVAINPDSAWRQKHWKSLAIAYQGAAYFEKFDQDLARLYQREWQSLFELNLETIRLVRELLGITTPMVFLSRFSADSSGGSTLVRGLQAVGAKEYLCEENTVPEGIKTELARVGISLRAANTSSRPGPWHQLFDPFIADLSIVDMLFNEGVDCLNILRQPF